MHFLLKILPLGLVVTFLSSHKMTLQLDSEATAFFLYSLQMSMAMFGAKIEIQCLWFVIVVKASSFWE